MGASAAPPVTSAASAATQPSRTAAAGPTAASTAPVQPLPSSSASNIHPMTTRSKAKHTLLSTTISPVPNSYAEAFADPHWLSAMQAEFSVLQENGTWELVPRPIDRPIIRCMWLLRHKFRSDGSLERYKARLVPCSMGFATGGRTFFLWGGCMMMHADDFRMDKHGVVTQLRDGGYSDDMTLAAIAGAHKRLITSPPVAVFPHPLASDLTFSRYWNYLRKQTFVLESYTTYINWIMNRALFSVHCYLSWGFVSPYIMAMFHIAAALRFHFKDNLIEEPVLNPNGLRLVGCLIICTAIELLSMWNLTRIEVRLCNMLSPEAPPLSLWCL
ncbi:putative ceramide glucosyltransferase, nucleotide-diphospho-sugar transferase [Helianthus debilis subsp. tardiflorus]